MADNSRIRNLAVLIVLVSLFAVPSLFLPSSLVLDIVSLFMLIFACTGLYLVTDEAWRAFWDGARDRAALALYGLFALFLSILLMRSYGILTRNIPSAQSVLEATHLYAAFVYLQFCGLYLFTRGATAPAVEGKRSRFGQLIAGIVIGALIASSKAIEPILMGIGKVLGRVFG